MFKIGSISDLNSRLIAQGTTQEIPKKAFKGAIYFNTTTNELLRNESDVFDTPNFHSFATPAGDIVGMALALAD